VRITKEGGKVLAENPAGIDVKYLKRYPSFVEFRNASKEAKHTDANGEDESETPDEQLDTAYKKLRAALVDDLLSQVKQSSPAFFERLVVELLVAMGYGGSIEDAGKAVGRTGDGGIDGIIKEDRLGLDAVVVQAKRWDTNVVGRPDVQAFAGSMEPHRARKGVFITTSSFSSQAEEYVRQIERKIVLIDGPTLASYMIDYGVGVTTYRTFVLKKVDSDYFEELDR